MLQLTLLFIQMVLLIACNVYAAFPVQGKVTLTVKADGEQPTGWPIVLELTLTNIGQGPINWWTAGPDSYPQAELFNVQVRYGAEDGWRDLRPSNGQGIQGSGITRQLKNGEVSTVPLALPVEKKGGVSFRKSRLRVGATGYIT